MITSILKNNYMKALIIFALIFMLAWAFYGCTATDHGRCRPEFMSGYGDKRK